MGPIQKALDEIRWAIPQAILKEAFRAEPVSYLERRRSVPVSLNARIREEILDKKVLVDCNLLGGTEAVIDLSCIVPMQTQDNHYVYNVPDNQLKGRQITSVLSVFDKTISSSLLGSQGDSGLLTGAVSGMFNALAGDGMYADPSVRLIERNTVLVENSTLFSGSLALRCRVTNDAQYSTLPPAAWLDFSRLCILATRAYIYNEMAIRLDEGFISAGMSLGKMKDLIDEMSDSHQMYNEYLNEEWARAMAIHDPSQHRRSIGFQFGLY